MKALKPADLFIKELLPTSRVIKEEANFKLEG